MPVLLYLGARLALSAPSSGNGLGASIQLGRPHRSGSAGLGVKAPQVFRPEFWTPAQPHTSSPMFPSQCDRNTREGFNDLTESLKILWQVQNLNPRLPNQWPVPSLPFFLDQGKLGILFS